MMHVSGDDATVCDVVMFDNWPEAMQKMATRVVLSRMVERAAKPVEAMVGENIRDARSASSALIRGDVRAATEALIRIEHRSVEDFVDDET